MDPRLSPDGTLRSPDSGMMDTSSDNQGFAGSNNPMDSDVYSEHPPAAGTPSSLSNVTLTADGGSTAPDHNGNSKRKRFVKVVEVDAPNNLDLDAYIANYKGTIEFASCT